MFDHVKMIKSWTTIACHVDVPTYCNVMAINVCDMQNKGIEGQLVFWHCLSQIIAQNGMFDATFEEFICDSAQNNVNAVCIVYGIWNPSIPMVNGERTCLFPWATNMDKHTEKTIAKQFQNLHI